jgi:predicted YcjX-like family ATPase
LPLSSITNAVGDAARNLGDYASGLVHPTVRLGVTGLSRAGKTVFLTALVHNLVNGGRLPFFDTVAKGRVARAYLEPQPNDDVPRFEYERHLADLTSENRKWPEGTRRISQLRLTLEYRPRGFWKQQLGYDRLHVDIVDYPGEWLLDLPLLHKSYAVWSAEAIALAREKGRAALAKDWRNALSATDPGAPASEEEALRLSDLFKDYLRRSREEPHALSTVPPGRFLMPGDLEGSPALTFAPLDAGEGASFAEGSLWSMMERRYEAYKRHVARPFFRDHFARLDRQIVLVDTLTALNAGPGAVADLERALAQILECFRAGSNNILTSLFAPRIDRILFAATKADHLHHEMHDRLEAILARLTQNAMKRAQFAGAEVKTLALAAVRATREGEVTRSGETLPCIIGAPLAGETIGRRKFDGEEEFAIFPGDLPADPERALREGTDAAEEVRVVRFRPPVAGRSADGAARPLPHIRLDRAMETLLGDRLA